MIFFRCNNPTTVWSDKVPFGTATVYIHGFTLYLTFRFTDKRRTDIISYSNFTETAKIQWCYVLQLFFIVYFLSSLGGILGKNLAFTFITIFELIVLLILWSFHSVYDYIDIDIITEVQFCCFHFIVRCVFNKKYF